MATIIDPTGKEQEVKLDVTVYKAAMQEELSVPQYINRHFPTAPDAKASSFEQLCVSSGLIVGHNKEFGLRAPSIGAILDGRAELNATAVADANPISRILYPAVFLEMIEDRLQVDRATDANNFDKLVAMDMSVTSNRIEQPVINLSRNAGARAKVISQLAEPQALLRITTSDTSRAISTFSIGLEVSDQALQSTTMDFVSMIIGRQSEEERNLRSYDYLLACLNGDLDNGQAALGQTKADTYDSTIAAAGGLTKKALISWLVNNYYKRQISHVVTDLAGMLSIENALVNSNTNQQIPGALVPQFSIMNRVLQNLQVFVVDPTAGWPANTLMGLDSRYAIARVRNSAAAYSAVEQFVLRRASALRFDFAELAYRVFDDAFDTLSLTLTT